MSTPKLFEGFDVVKWHAGFRYPVRKGWRWSNNWLSHGCGDLALPFELGVRAYHHREQEGGVMAQWVRVEFYGRMPEGQQLEQVNILEAGEHLARAFGFTHIDDLTADDATGEHVEPGTAQWEAECAEFGCHEGTA